MTDIKISQLPELSPTNLLENEEGVSNNDILTILDISETDVSLINKKVKVSTLLEKTAPINSPNFTGIPTTTTSLLNDNSNRLATTEFVQELFTQSTSGTTFSNLSDVNISSPLNNQTIVFDSLSNTFINRTGVPVIRQTLTTNKTLLLGSECYQFLNAQTSAKDVILPIGQLGLKFVIKNIGNFDLNIKDNTNTVIVTLTTTERIADFIYDGIEWQVLLY